MDKKEIEKMNKVGSIPVIDGGSVTDDNLAIALATYFEDHPDRPETDEINDETGWGDWVKWEDLVKFIEKDPNECNCDFFMRTQSGSWICPAHGYKKI
jgi:hypothetical protein